MSDSPTAPRERETALEALTRGACEGDERCPECRRSFGHSNFCSLRSPAPPMSALDQQVVEALDNFRADILYIQPGNNMKALDYYCAEARDALLTTHRRQVLTEVRTQYWESHKRLNVRIEPFAAWLDTQLPRDTKENTDE